jgi:hypothetical protein
MTRTRLKEVHVRALQPAFNAGKGISNRKRRVEHAWVRDESYEAEQGRCRNSHSPRAIQEVLPPSPGTRMLPTP